VSILNHSACSGCHAKGVCSVADFKEKEIEILYSGKSYTPGREVTVVLKEMLGFKALLYGYLLPFILVLSILLIVYNITGNDITAGFIALSVLIPYYTILYLFRNYMKKVFRFELDETDLT